MTRGVALVATLAALGWVPTATAQGVSDPPACVGDTSAAAVTAKPGPLLRFGITPLVQAGQIGAVPAPAVPEQPERSNTALERLRPADGPFVLRLNRFFWSDREAGIRRYEALAERFTSRGFLVELQVRYHPDASQEGDIPAWVAHVREVVRRFGANPRVVALQITNEVNITFSPDSSDGSYAEARQALVDGVVAAKDEARKLGHEQLEIGFNWAYRLDPGQETSFWNGLRDRGGGKFVKALDWIGLDAYPGTVFPPAEATLEDYRDGMVNAMSAIRCYAKIPGIPPSVPIHIEENGWPTPPGRSYDMQADVLDAMVQATHDFRGTYNVTDYRWFNLRDGETGSPQLFQNFGLLEDDYDEKASFARYDAAVQKLSVRDPLPTSRPGCLPSALRFGLRGLGPVRLGRNRAAVQKAAGEPSARAGGRFRYCVAGGGATHLAFSRPGDLRLVASTARRHRARGIGAGSSLRSLRRVYPRAYNVGRGLLASRRSSRIVFGVRGSRVRFVAAAGRREVQRPRLLRYYLRRAGL